MLVESFFKRLSEQDCNSARRAIQRELERQSVPRRAIYVQNVREGCDERLPERGAPGHRGGTPTDA